MNDDFNNIIVEEDISKTTKSKSKSKPRKSHRKNTESFGKYKKLIGKPLFKNQKDYDILIKNIHFHKRDGVFLKPVYVQVYEDIVKKIKYPNLIENGIDYWADHYEYLIRNNLLTRCKSDFESHQTKNPNGWRNTCNTTVLCVFTIEEILSSFVKYEIFWKYFFKN